MIGAEVLCHIKQCRLSFGWLVKDQRLRVDLPNFDPEIFKPRGHPSCGSSGLKNLAADFQTFPKAPCTHKGSFKGKHKGFYKSSMRVLL